MKIKYIKNGYDYEVWLVERLYNHERALKEFNRMNNYGGEYSKFIKPIDMSDESWFYRVCQTRREGTRLLGVIRKMNYDTSNVCWSIYTHKHTARFSDVSVLEEYEDHLNHTFMSYPTLSQAKDRFEDNIFEKYSAGMKLESKF